MNDFLQYGLIFILAATPWIEVLLAVPAGLALGLQPALVAVIVFVGNAAPVFLLVYGYQYWQIWRSAGQENNSGEPDKRWQRAQTVMNRYGLPGLAFLGPLLTGIHLATLIALLMKPSKTKVLLWMNASLLAWTIGLTLASFYGFKGLGLMMG